MQDAAASFSNVDSNLGKFITFEGIDGAGKTSQIQQIKDLLSNHNIQSVITEEPGGTVLGNSIRSV
ncbi:MAG: hypothetical protein COB50_00415, partial [Thiotrichales bacterium]